ncbi:MAG TPA: MFS transporter, partial [Chroococcales cyanobacterium]
WNEYRVKEPFIRLSYFRSAIINISCVSVLVSGMGMFGGSLVLPIFFQTVLGYSASVSGFLLSPLIVSVALASIVGGAVMSSSKRYKLLLLAGLSFMAAGTIMLSFPQARVSFVYVIFCLLFASFGLGLILPVYTVVIQNSVSQEEIGAVTGFSQFFRSVGGTLGVALSGAVITAIYANSIAELVDLDGPPYAQFNLVMDNPLDPVRMRQALLSCPNLSGTSVDWILQHASQTLALAISDIFRTYGMLLVATVALNLFLAELPLRETSRLSSDRQESVSG